MFLSGARNCWCDFCVHDFSKLLKMLSCTKAYFLNLYLSAEMYFSKLLKSNFVDEFNFK